MKKLDEQYITQLVRKAQNGNSNAFAELFTATYQDQYSYAYQYLREEEKAKTAIAETYKRALTDIRMMKNPEHFQMWLELINFQACYEMNEADETGYMLIDGKLYKVSHVIKNLPLTEAQILVRYYYRDEDIRKIRKDLGVRKALVERYIKSGRKHLQQLLHE